LPVTHLVRRRLHVEPHAASISGPDSDHECIIYSYQMQALSKATSELGVRTEMSEKWELKTGEMQQKIIELEK
jgi:hypothetical protein